MTFFSRCDTSHFAESNRRTAPGRRARLGPPSALAGFAEDIGILFRYALGLDYYGRRHLRPQDR